MMLRSRSKKRVYKSRSRDYKNIPISDMTDRHLDNAIRKNLKVVRIWANRLQELSTHLSTNQFVIDDKLETEWATARATFNTACTNRKKLLDEKLERKFKARKISPTNGYKPFHRDRVGG